MNKIKVGVVGVGHLGSIHAKIYQQLENCSLVAVCDIDKGAAQSAAKKCGIKT